MAIAILMIAIATRRMAAAPAGVSGKLPWETARFVRATFDLSPIGSVLPGLETRHADGPTLELCAPSAAVSH